MRRRDETWGSKADPMPSGSSESEHLPDLVRRSLRGLLAQTWPENEPKGDVRLALRDACDRARKEGLRAEQLLLVLKDAWSGLPERRQLPRVDTDAVLARVVTACIDEYYLTPRTGPERGQGRPLHSEAGHGRADSQNAELS